MIENKDTPTEFVSIRQVWLRQIDRCTEALSHRFMKDVQDERSEASGSQTVVESIVALQYCLIDYGEATLKSDLKEWLKEHPDEEGVPRAKRKFEFIIERMNRYGLLFESSPEGYSNTEMKSI